MVASDATALTPGVAVVLPSRGAAGLTSCNVRKVP